MQNEYKEYVDEQFSKMCADVNNSGNYDPFGPEEPMWITQADTIETVF